MSQRTTQNRTIGSALAEANGIGPGFDALRLALAITIVFVHCFPIATGSTAVIGPQLVTPTPVSLHLAAVAAPSPGILGWIKSTLLHKHNDHAHFANVLVPMFFALSGFLVTGSACRLRSLTNFLAARALRIIPALFVEVSLSALILGPLVTTFEPRAYFSDPAFFEYFGNIVGRIKYTLPGVFTANPDANIVNSNLWTLPSEFYCYAIIALLIVTGALFVKRTFLVIGMASIIAVAVVDRVYAGAFSSEIQRNAVFLTVFFFCGSLIYQFKEHLPLAWPIALASTILVYLDIIASPDIHSWLQYFRIFGLSYLTIYLGLLRLPVPPVGDISYGIYLYGYPISQTLVFEFQMFRGQPVLLFAAAILLTAAFAAASWRFFEEPALRLRRLLAHRQIARLSAQPLH